MTDIQASPKYRKFLKQNKDLEVIKHSVAKGGLMLEENLI
jgi:hypothetical protein